MTVVELSALVAAAASCAAWRLAAGAASALTPTDKLQLQLAAFNPECVRAFLHLRLQLLKPKKTEITDKLRQEINKASAG